MSLTILNTSETILVRFLIGNQSEIHSTFRNTNTNWFQVIMILAK